MNSKAILTLLALVLIPLSLAACGDDDDNADKGEGTVKVTAWGEEYIEEGIPADEMDDGWAITFDKFIVTIDEVEVGGVAIATPDPIDISGASDGKGHALASATVPAGSHKEPSFAIKRVEMAGSATKDSATKTFDWTFDQPTHYAECDTTTEVTDGGESTFQITIHADHFFGDSLVSEDPQLLFGALADADTDGDGTISRAELEAADIGAYDPGSQGGVDNLWQFLSAHSQTLGHVDGEGHCHAHSQAH